MSGYLEGMALLIERQPTGARTAAGGRRRSPPGTRRPDAGPAVAGGGPPHRPADADAELDDWSSSACGAQQARDGRRHKLEGTVEPNQRGALRSNGRNRQTYIDLARLDIAGYMSATSPQPPENIDLADARDLLRPPPRLSSS